MIEIYTSYFANYRSTPPDYQCVSIANTKPDSCFIPRWGAVLPAWEYVRAYKQKEISMTEFMTMYGAQLDRHRALVYYADLVKYATGATNPSGSLEFLMHVDMSKARPVVLMCWEKEAEYCHRVMLAYYLAKNCAGIIYKGEI